MSKKYTTEIPNPRPPMMYQDPQRVPIVDDTKPTKTFCILYARQEGEHFMPYFCKNEAEADLLLHEYEHSGALSLYSYRGLDIVKPIAVLKSEVTRSLRKEYRTGWK